MALFDWLRTPTSDVLSKLKRAENAQQELTRRFDALELEWESVLDKIARYTARQAARTRREIERAVDGSTDPTTPTPETQAVGSSPALPTSKAELRRLLNNGAIRRLGG